jgi:hypothetical protein
MTDRVYEEHSLEWQGMRIAIRYCRSYFDFYEEIYGHPLAHLEIETIDPARAALPISETGYLSHFTGPEAIEAAAGPVAYVQAALDEAANDPAWIARQAAARQLALF